MQQVKTSQTGDQSAARSTDSNISVQLYSPHELHHAALQHLCSDGSGFALECTNRELPHNLKLLEAMKPDVIILDIALFVEKGPDAIQAALRSLCEYTTVILLADQIDTLLMRRAMASGVSGYLLTTLPLDSFRSALQTVAAGGLWFGLDSTMLPGASSFAERIVRSLSERERQILNYVANGLTSKEVANRLGLSQSSVRTYWYRVLSKLNALNKAEALVRAASLGLLDPEYAESYP